MKDKDPLFLAILNGSFVFAADLIRKITIPMPDLICKTRHPIPVRLQRKI
jgi:hypoxanthine-guanine phosphoribosyltransferase